MTIYVDDKESLNRCDIALGSALFVRSEEVFIASDIVQYNCFFFSSRRRHTRSLCDWSSDVCSSDLRRRVVTTPDPPPSRRFSICDRSRGWHLRSCEPHRRSEERRVGKECRSRWSADH